MPGNMPDPVVYAYGFDYYEGAPTRPETGNFMLLRGDSSMFDERFRRASVRFRARPEAEDRTPVGFRCVIGR